MQVKERVLEALQQPIHFTTSTCAWPAQFVPAAIVTGAKDFYIGGELLQGCSRPIARSVASFLRHGVHAAVATRRDLGFASLEVSTAELAVDNETIPDVIVTLAKDGYLRGSRVRLFLCAILQALNETNMSAERPALLLKVGHAQMYQCIIPSQDLLAQCLGCNALWTGDPGGRPPEKAGLHWRSPGSPRGRVAANIPAGHRQGGASGAQLVGF